MNASLIKFKLYNLRNCTYHTLKHVKISLRFVEKIFIIVCLPESMVLMNSWLIASFKNEKQVIYFLLIINICHEILKTFSINYEKKGISFLPKNKDLLSTLGHF